MNFFDWVQDWNGDGVKDAGDAAMEYQIFQQVTGDGAGDQSEEADDE